MLQFRKCFHVDSLMCLSQEWAGDSAFFPELKLVLILSSSLCAAFTLSHETAGYSLGGLPFPELATF